MFIFFLISSVKISSLICGAREFLRREVRVQANWNSQRCSYPRLETWAYVQYKILAHELLFTQYVYTFSSAWVYKSSKLEM